MADYMGLWNYVYDWQTLIAGSLAIVAALVGGYFINKQIRKSEEQERNRLHRHHEAVRAVMPLSLMALIDYATGSADALRLVLSNAQGQTIPSSALIPVFPDAPSQAITSLREFIESADDEITRPFFDILLKIQIQIARVRSMPDRCAGRGYSPHSILTVAEVEEYVLDCAAIHARSSSLFKYARRETNDVPLGISWNEVRNSLRLMGFWPEPASSLYDTIKKREASDDVP